MPAATTITVSDPALRAQLAAAEGQIVFRDEAGEHVCTVEVIAPQERRDSYRVPFGEEELDRRDRVQTGRPLADIMRDLEAEYGR